MRAVILIGTNFVRTQWVALLVMLVYVAGLNGFVAWHIEKAEVLQFLHLQSLYAISFVALITVPAIQTERKTRRILAVLSKGIHRWQYLGGLLCGCVMIAVLFHGAIIAATLWLALRAGLPIGGLVGFFLIGVFASAAAAAVSLFCATFLHPVVAMAVVSGILAGPFLAESGGWHAPGLLFPVAAASRWVLAFRFEVPAGAAAQICAAAVLHAVIFWLAASVVFARRDVTTATE